MIRKILLAMVVITTFGCNVQANELIEKAKKLSPSECQKIYAPLSMQLIWQRVNSEYHRYSDVLDVDFADYSIDELEELMDYIENIGDDAEHIVEVEPCNDFITSQDKACFMFYSTVQDSSGFFDYVTQNKNPEIIFDVETQTADVLRLYMTYFADCTSEEAKQNVELYTDELIYAMNSTYPNVCINFLSVSWKIPSINEDSLYAAKFFCEKDGDSLTRGDGSGLIYQE